jgi:hypothetical protein
MLHTCVRKFDVMGVVENFLGTKHPLRGTGTRDPHEENTNFGCEHLTTWTKMKHLTVSCDFESKVPTRLFTSGPDARTVVLYLFFVVVVIAAG